MGKKIDLQNGDRFGRLTIIKYDGTHKKPCGTTQSKYLCQCDCGNMVSVLAQNLKNGNTKSCGCLSKESKDNRKLPNNKGVINQIILGYKRHAKRRNLSWELTAENVADIICQPCYYCGVRNSNKKYTKNCKEGFEYNGIDRVDNTSGYILGNVVPCCKTCNSAKSNMSQIEFVLWAKRVAEHTSFMADQWGKFIEEQA